MKRFVGEGVQCEFDIRRVETSNSRLLDGYSRREAVSLAHPVAIKLSLTSKVSKELLAVNSLASRLSSMFRVTFVVPAKLPKAEESEDGGIVPITSLPHPNSQSPPSSGGKLRRELGTREFAVAFTLLSIYVTFAHVCPRARPREVNAENELIETRIIEVPHILSFLSRPQGRPFPEPARRRSWYTMFRTVCPAITARR